MTESRLDRQLAFVIEADQLKRVVRKNLVLGQTRPENSGEHSWHLALAAIVLAEHAADRDVDLNRVLRMLLVHDLVEIDAGDTYLYDDAGRATKAAREQAAADRIFGLLPDDQAEWMRACWDEFEARETPEARYAAAVDRLMPMLLNFIAEGVVWKQHGVTRAQIVARCAHMAEGAPALWDMAEKLLDDAVERGYLPPETSTDDVLPRPLTADGSVARLHVLTERRPTEAGPVSDGPAQEADFRRVVDRLGYPVVIIRDSQVVYANEALGQLLGYDEPSELTAVPLEELLHPSEADEAMARLRVVEKSGAIVGGQERRLRRVDGELITVALSSPRRVRFDGEQAVLIVARDVTDERLVEARLRLADRLTSVGTLAAGVAHEVNNPLASVVANLSVLEEELVDLSVGLPPEEAAELMDIVADARLGADRVQQIVRDLSTFARVDATTLGLVDVNRGLEATLNIAAPQIRHRARVVKSLSPVAPVQGNEARLGQVFLHLVLNAVHAMPTGRAAENELRVWTRDDGAGSVVIGVEDTGRGMSDDVKRRIFEPFYTTKPVGEGTGLGLSISHSIVEQMGGSIEVSSVLGEGSQFTVRLPAAQRERRTPPDGLRVPSTLAPSRILVVDDEPMIIKSLQRLLKGHDVSVATSGREALAALERREFDLVVCDLIMPDLSGIDVYQEVQRLRPGDEARIVFITGGAFTPETAAFLQSIPNIWIEKPFDLKAVRAFVDLELGRR